MGNWRAFILISLLFLFFIVGTLPGLAQSPDAFHRSIEVAKQQLEPLTACEWHDSGTDTVCLSDAIDGSVTLHESAADGTLETVEIFALLKAPPGQHSREEHSADVVIAVIKKMLPEWDSSSRWMKAALHRAQRYRYKGASITKIGRITVFVQWLLPADIEGEFASIVITRQSSIEPWRFGD